MAQNLEQRIAALPAPDDIAKIFAEGIFDPKIKQ